MTGRIPPGHKSGGEHLFYLHLRPAFGSALTLLVTAFAVLMRHVVWTWIQASDLISAMADRRSIMSSIISMRWADHLGEIASLSS